MPRISKKENEYFQAPAAEKKTQIMQAYKTALYARLSVEDNGKGGDSLEAQLQGLHNYIEGKSEFKYCGEFTDNGFSGTNYDRPGFQAMIEQVKNGKIDCIIVKDLSRLGRNYIDTGVFIEKFCPLYKLRLISINDNYDTAYKNASSDMSMSVMNIANDMYAKDISKKLSSSFSARMERGEFVRGLAPYGYLIDSENKRHLIPDPELIQVINRIFEMRADGMGIGSILRVLNNEGIPSPGRYRFEHGIITNNNKKGAALLWNRHVLEDILRNEVYIGNMVQGKSNTALYKGVPFHWTDKDEWIRVEGTHEAIVPRELFERVQTVDRERRDKYKRNYDKFSYLPKGENFYGSKMTCADCGRVIKLVRSIANDGKSAYFTYKCPNYIEHGESGCTKKFIRKPELDSAVLATIQAHIKLFVKKKEVLKKLEQIDTEKSEHFRKKKKIRDLEKRIKQRDSLIAGIYTDVRSGLITQDEYLYSKNMYTREIESLKEELNSLNKEMDQKIVSMDKFSHWGYLVEKYGDIKELDNDVVEAFVKEIKFGNNNSIEITLNYMDEFESAKKICRKRGKETA